MNSKSIKKQIKSIIFVVLFATMLAVLCEVFTPKTSDLQGGMTNPNARGFYGERKNSIDLLVLGDSNAYCAYSPMFIWKKYGIPSYVAAEGNQNIVGALNILDEVLECQSPKVMIFDVNMLWSGKTDTQRTEDCITNILYKYVPIIKYHNRWKNMSLGDGFKGKNYTYRSSTRGQNLSRKVLPYVGEDKMQESDEVDDIPWITKFFFEKLLKKCEKNGIKVVLMEAPTATSWTYARHVVMEAYAEEHDMTFIDFNTLTGKYAIDWSEDTRDGGMHMNSYGARKVTAYLGKYLTSNYTFENKQDDIEYANWNKEYAEYRSYMLKKKIYIEVDSDDVQEPGNAGEGE